MERVINTLGWLSRRGFTVLVFAVVITAAIFAFRFGIASLPLELGDILSFMGIWLAIGVLLGQNKPPSTPLWGYLRRRLTAYLCCYVFFIVIAMSYADIRGGHAPDEFHWQELVGLLVVSFLSAAVGFLAGQDKEPEGGSGP